MTRERTPEEAAIILRKIGRNVDDREALAHAFADAVLRQAVQNAAGHPTPQSRLAAQSFAVRGSLIIGGSPLAWGSERGSMIYRQFGPRREGGAWLMPAGSQPAPVRTAREWIDNAVEKEL